jgi:hypothetical protein
LEIIALKATDSAATIAGAMPAISQIRFTADCMSRRWTGERFVLSTIRWDWWPAH